MALTDSAIRTAAPSDRTRALSDGLGLFLVVRPDGSRWWRFRYHFAGHENTLSFGTYPKTNLTAARRARRHARWLLVNGVDPSAHRKAARNAVPATVEALLIEHLHAHRPRLAPSTLAKRIGHFKRYLFPRLGATPLRSLRPEQLLDTFDWVESFTTPAAAKTLRASTRRALEYAVSTRHLSVRAARLLLDACNASDAPSTRACSPVDVIETIYAIVRLENQRPEGALLQLALMLLQPPSVVRELTWRQIQLPKSVRQGHGRDDVASDELLLSRQAVELLQSR